MGKWIREKQSFKHRIDIWHVSKSICKNLGNARKERGWAISGECINGIRNHLYCCVLSTNQGSGEMVHAKCVSFLWNIANKHSTYQSYLFPNCAHGHIENTKLIKVGNYIFLISACMVNFTTVANIWGVRGGNASTIISDFTCYNTNGVLALPVPWLS